MTAGQRFDLVILAGGRGTRLKARTGDLPKPMAPIAGRPALEHQLALCRRHGFDRVLLLLHHGHEAIQRHFGDGTSFGVTLGCHVEAAPRGTAGALRDSLASLAGTFLVLYGDTYVDVDLRRLWDTHRQAGADATLFVHPNDHPFDSDLVEVDAAGFVTTLHPCPHPEGADLENLVTAGLFVLQNDGLQERIPADRPSDLAKHTIPGLLADGRRLLAYRSPEYIKDFGTPERLDRVERDVRNGIAERLSGRALRHAVFLDRDGTLNRDVNHLKHPDQIELLDGAPAAIRRLNQAARLTVVITNQSALARGELTGEGLQRVHARLSSLLGRQGAYLDAMYVCPHHPDRGFPGEIPELKVACDCRKPGTGSIDAACRDLLVDRAGAWMIGDTTSDIESGRRAGLRTILVRTGHAGSDGKFPFRPDYVTSDLGAAASWILDGHPTMCRRLAPVAAAAREARLVVIGGLARTGKSSAAQILKETMHVWGRETHILPFDSWLKPQGERAEGTGVDSRFDTRQLLDVVAPLVGAAERRTLDLPIYDRARRAMYDRPVQISIGPEDLVIVEGVPALMSDELAARADLRVHMEIAESARVELLHADYRWRGESGERLAALLASRAADETGPVEAARSRADFVVTAWARE